jgi:transposase
MNSLPVFVGLDYSDASVQVCVMDESGKVLSNRGCDNDWRKIDQQVRQFGTVRHAAIESCTGAADLAEELIEHARWRLDMAHPGYVAKARQSPDKTDFSDGKLLADLTRVGYLPRVWLPPKPVRELRRLVRLREARAKQRRATKLRIRAILREHRVRCEESTSWTKPWLAWLRRLELPQESRWIIERELAFLTYIQSDLKMIEERLEQATEHDTVVQKLRDQPGVGPVTSWILRAMIGRFDRFRTGKQLARFCSVSPRNASSGTRQADAGLIRAGDPLLRATLIELAQRLMRGKGRWRELADSLRARGKPYCVTAAAVANRLVRWLFHAMRETEKPLTGESGVMASAPVNIDATAVLRSEASRQRTGSLRRK